MQDLLINLGDVVQSVPFFLLLLVSLLLGKLFYDKTTIYAFDEELTEKDNRAFGVHFAMYLLGLMIAVTGSLSRGVSYDAIGLGLVAGSCVFAIVLMRVGVWIVDTFLLNRFSVEKEMIKDRNVGTGFALGGGCIASGLLINGAMSVETTGNEIVLAFINALLYTSVFFVVGQILLILGARVFQLITPYDVHQIIADDDNMAAGISFGGFLIALGIIVRTALLDASAILGIEILTAVVYAAIGFVLLFAARIFADRVLLPKSPLSKEVVVDKNPAAGAVAAACFICVALAFSWAVTT